MDKPTGIRRLLNACKYSSQGLQACFRSEEAFRQEVFLALIMIPLGLYLGDSAVEKILLAGSILMLMTVEIINTAIERVVDRISFDRHELSKEAKDMGSAAVMIAIVLVIMTWGLIIFL